MSTYELDDGLVARVISGKTTGTEQDALFLHLERQLPKAEPTGLGAVVRVDNAESPVWVRFNTDTNPHGLSWIDPQDGEQQTSANIGRITEVLFEGVDL